MMKMKMKVEDEQESMEKLLLLPEIIMTEILPRVPADSVLGCKLVCRSWRAWIEDPSFIDLHNRRLVSSQIENPLINPSLVSLYLYELSDDGSMSDVHRCVDFNDDDVDDEVTPFKVTKRINIRELLFDFEKWPIIVGSANGLICMCSDVVYIFNPFTGESLKLPDFDNDAYVSNSALGFGYAPSTDEYKVVCVFYKSMACTKGDIQVYTLGNGGWRSIGEVDFSLRQYGYDGVYLNGGLHWLNKKLEIVSFDLAVEKFRVLRLPPLPPRPPPPPILGDLPICRYKLGVMGGRFSVQCEGDGGNYDIWVLNGGSWVKQFSIPWEVPDFWIEHLALLRSGRLLLTSRTKKASFCYDPRTGKVDSYQGFYGFYATPYVKSFLSLKALGEDASAMRTMMKSFASLDVGGGEEDASTVS